MRPSIRRQSLILILALALLVPAKAIAQRPTPQDTDDDPIVVEGMAATEQEIQRYVEALTDAPVGGQIARFDWQVCPAAVGLPEAQSAEIADRMRRVAAAASVPLAQAGCRPNALLIVTPDKAQTLARMRRQAPNYFRNERGERAPLIDETGSVTAWQLEGRLDEDGRPMTINDAPEGNPRGSGTVYVTESTRSPSRLTAASRPHFIASFVVIQLDALRGLSTTQVADYAAMRMFARTEPSRLQRSSVPTILNVIDAPMGQALPVTMTLWDLGFLRALYQSTDNQYASRQRGQMRRLLRGDLNGARASRDD